MGEAKRRRQWELLSSYGRLTDESQGGTYTYEEMNSAPVEEPGSDSTEAEESRPTEK